MTINETVVKVGGGGILMPTNIAIIKPSHFGSMRKNERRMMLKNIFKTNHIKGVRK